MSKQEVRRSAPLHLAQIQNALQELDISDKFMGPRAPTNYQDEAVFYYEIPGGERFELFELDWELDATMLFVFLSTKGAKLLSWAKSYQPDEGAIAIFMEHNGGDSFSDQVFEIVLNKYDSDSPVVVYEKVKPIVPIMVRALHLPNRSTLMDLIAQKLEPDNRISRFGDYLSEVITMLKDWLVGLLEQAIEKIGTFKLEESFWKQSSLPPNWNRRIDELGQEIDQALNSILQDIETLLRLDLGKFQTLIIEKLGDNILTRNVVNEFLPWLLEKLHGFDAELEGIRQLLRRGIQLVRDLKPDVADSIRTWIGFMCGLWDAIVDAVAGFVDLIKMGLHLMDFSVKAHTSPLDMYDFLLEVLDQIGAFANAVDWPHFWYIMETETIPKIRLAISMGFDDVFHKLSSSNSEAGYYYGYLIYNVLESAFPPLKFSKLSRASKAAVKSAENLGKIMDR